MSNMTSAEEMTSADDVHQHSTLTKTQQKLNWEPFCVVLRIMCFSKTYFPSFHSVCPVHKLTA